MKAALAVALSMLACASAQASSILTLGESSTANISTTTLGAASGSPSIVALGEPAAEMEKTAAASIAPDGAAPEAPIPDFVADQTLLDIPAASDAARARPVVPIVMRGGLSGDAFAPVPAQRAAPARTPRVVTTDRVEPASEAQPGAPATRPSRLQPIQ